MRERPVGAGPWVVSLVVLAGGVVAGFVAMVLGWRGVAGRTAVAEQLPYLLSGAFGGVALVGVAVGLLVIQTRRRAEALRRADLRRVQRAVMALTAVVRGDASGVR